MPRRLIDVTGQRFGRLVVLRRTSRTGNTYWRCRCDCGNETEVAGGKLRGGGTTSCGCFQKEIVAALGRANTTHGHCGTPAWRSWSAMRARILNKGDKDYAIYGGRGITICARWDDFQCFLDDMGERPEGMTLDRIDVDGNYEPQNCRWADIGTQNRNMRHHKGEVPGRAERVKEAMEHRSRSAAWRAALSAGQLRRWARVRAEKGGM